MMRGTTLSRVLDLVRCDPTIRPRVVAYTLGISKNSAKVAMYTLRKRGLIPSPTTRTGPSASQSSGARAASPSLRGARSSSTASLPPVSSPSRGHSAGGSVMESPATLSREG